jgi:hypothetical protein
MYKVVFAILFIVAVSGSKFLNIEQEFAPLTDEFHNYINSVQHDWVAGHNTRFMGKDTKFV